MKGCCCEGEQAAGARPKQRCGCSEGHLEDKGRVHSKRRSNSALEWLSANSTTGYLPDLSGGCGRVNCQKNIRPPPEVEWEYTSYNTNGRGWSATPVENSCPGDYESSTYGNCRPTEEQYQGFADVEDKSFARVGGGGCDKTYPDAGNTNLASNNRYEARNNSVNQENGFEGEQFSRHQCEKCNREFWAPCHPRETKRVHF